MERLDTPTLIRLTDAVVAALKSERHRLSAVNPQFSYYQRLVDFARYDHNELHRIHSHVVKHGGFAGL